MKKLIIGLLFLFCINSYSQTWTANVYQDIKLALFEDDYGNSPYTMDIVGKTQLHFENSNIFLYPQLEVALLSGGDYLRASTGIGYVINKTKWIDFSPSVNWGLIERWGHCYKGVEFQLDTSLKISDHLRVSFLKNLYTKNRFR